jgi:poly(A) polymerase Pap1
MSLIDIYLPKYGKRLATYYKPTLNELEAFLYKNGIFCNRIELKEQYDKILTILKQDNNINLTGNLPSELKKELYFLEEKEFSNRNKKLFEKAFIVKAFLQLFEKLSLSESYIIEIIDGFCYKNNIKVFDFMKAGIYLSSNIDGMKIVGILKYKDLSDLLTESDKERIMVDTISLIEDSINLRCSNEYFSFYYIKEYIDIEKISKTLEDSFYEVF